MFINMVILVYKLLLYKYREKKAPPSLQVFKNTLSQIETIEKRIAVSKGKLDMHERKNGKK